MEMEVNSYARRQSNSTWQLQYLPQASKGQLLQEARAVLPVLE